VLKLERYARESPRTMAGMAGIDLSVSRIGGSGENSFLQTVTPGNLKACIGNMRCVGFVLKEHPRRIYGWV
jgi:hypothetical protein